METGEDGRGLGWCRGVYIRITRNKFIKNNNNKYAD